MIWKQMFFISSSKFLFLYNSRHIHYSYFYSYSQRIVSTLCYFSSFSSLRQFSCRLQFVHCCWFWVSDKYTPCMLFLFRMIARQQTEMENTFDRLSYLKKMSHCVFLLWSSNKSQQWHYIWQHNNHGSDNRFVVCVYACDTCGREWAFPYFCLSFKCLEHWKMCVWHMHVFLLTSARTLRI